MTTTGQKRSVDQVLNGQDTSQTPAIRQKLDKDVDQQVRRVESESPRITNKGAQTPPESLFLAYPDRFKPQQVSVPFQRPSQLISFSYDASHVQEYTDSAMRYFVQPRLGADLTYGYDRWIDRPNERGRLDALLRAIAKAKMDGAGKGVQIPEIGLISWRGVMTKLLTAPYEERDDWELNVMYFNGTLYFEEHSSDKRLQEKNNMEPRHRIQTYHGLAFESFCTSESPPDPRDRSAKSSHWGGDVNTNVQWCSVVRTKLGETRLILGGEVDCVREKYIGQPDSFVELKTSLTIRGRHDEERFERKLLKFYFQSFLLGVPEIVVGFRTPKGELMNVQTFKTVEIPRLVRGKDGAWDPLVCLEFGNRVITFLKSAIQNDKQTSSGGVWRVYFVPGSGLTVTKLNKAEVDDVENGEDRVGFLPRWYWDEIQGADSTG